MLIYNDCFTEGKGFATAGCVRSLNRRSQRLLISADSFRFHFAANGKASPFGYFRDCAFGVMLYCSTVSALAANLFRDRVGVFTEFGAQLLLASLVLHPRGGAG